MLNTDLFNLRLLISKETNTCFISKHIFSQEMILDGVPQFLSFLFISSHCFYLLRTPPKTTTSWNQCFQDCTEIFYSTVFRLIVSLKVAYYSFWYCASFNYARALPKKRVSITRVQNHASELRKSREHKNKMAAL